MAGATCVICCEAYTKPKVLPCGHSCCKECLRGWAERATDPPEEYIPDDKELDVVKELAPIPVTKDPIQVTAKSSTLTPKATRKASKSPTPTSTSRSTGQSSRTVTPTSRPTSQTSRTTPSRTPKATGQTPRTATTPTARSAGKTGSVAGQPRRLIGQGSKLTIPANRSVSSATTAQKAVGSPRLGTRKLQPRPESPRTTRKSESPLVTPRPESPLVTPQPETPDVTESQKSLTCPECRHQFELPENGVDGLPNNVALSRATEAEVPQCGDCKGRPRSLKCMECEEWLCTECGELHTQITATSSHTLVTLEQLKEGTTNPETPQTPVIEEQAPKPKSKYKSCPKHPDEPQKYFCMDCNEAICNDCLNVDHVVHMRMMLEDKAKEVMALYEYKKANNDQKIAYYKDRMRDINKADTNQKRNSDQTINSIRDRKQEICEHVGKRAEELVGQLEAHLTTQLRSNELYRNKILLDIDKLQAEKVLATMQNAMPHEVLELSQKLEEEVAKDEAASGRLREEPDPRWIKWTFQSKPVTLIENHGGSKEVKPLTDMEIVCMMFGDLARSTMAVNKGEVAEVNACNPQ